MARVDTNTNTQIRELAVCLGIADAVTGYRAYHLGNIDDWDYEEERPTWGTYEPNFDVGYTTAEYYTYIDEYGQKRLESAANLIEQGITIDDSFEPVSLKTIDYQHDPDWLKEYSECNEFDPSSLLDGADFCEALRFHNIIDNTGLACFTQKWTTNMKKIARDNYALGRYLATVFELHEGSVERITWYGRENSKGDDLLLTPPADIGVKLVGTPNRKHINNSYSQYDDLLQGATIVQCDDEENLVWVANNYDDVFTEEEWDQIIEYDDGSDILISLKDGSNIIGNRGFAALSNLILGTQHSNGINCFKYYASDEYENWFYIAWDLMIDWLYDNDYEFEYEESGDYYKISLIGDTGLHFYKYDHRDSNPHKNLEVDMNITLEQWEKKRSKAKKAFSMWCTHTENSGNKDRRYIEAQTACSRQAAWQFTNSMAEGAIPERFYNLVGWRMPEYYYAKIDGQGKDRYFISCLIPSVFNMGRDYPLTVIPNKDQMTVSEYEDDLTSSTSTQAIVPFTIQNTDIGINAQFQFIIRFADGMFYINPIVTISMVGEYSNTYVPLHDRTVYLSEFLPKMK